MKCQLKKKLCYFFKSEKWIFSTDFLKKSHSNVFFFTFQFKIYFISEKSNKIDHL